MKNIIFFALCFSAAAPGLVRAAETKPPAAAAVPAEAWKNKTFTAGELKKYNGKGGMPVYAAVDGIVYDLSKSKYWKAGQHMKMHEAGVDLSSAIHNQAPKGIHKDGMILGRMPKVGVLLKDAPAIAAPPAAGGVALHKIDKKELGKEERCAVTRKVLKVTETTSAVDYKGKTYYFSSVSLMDEFTRNPEKYLGALEKAKGLFRKKA